MKNLFIIEDTVSVKISYYHLMLLMLCLPFDLFYSHVVLASLIIHTLIYSKKADFKKLLRAGNFILASVFFLTLFSSLYTSYRVEAEIEIGRHITILLLPLVLSLNLIDLKKYRFNLLTGFSIGCALVVLYLFERALVTIHFFGFPLTTLFSNAFTNHNFSEPLEIHATFLSLQLSVAFIFLLSMLFKKQKPGQIISRNQKLLYSLCALILAAGFIQLSSKSVLLSMLLIVDLVLPFFLLEGKRRKLFIGAALAASLLVFVVLLNIPAFKIRFVTAFRRDLNLPTVIQDVTDSRLNRWKLAMNLVAERPVLGHGAGSEVALLHEEFYKNHFYNSFIFQLNAHNEFISILLKSGVLGLSIYLLTLVYGFRKAVEEHDVIFLSFMVLLVFVSLSENLLDVDKGIFFYALFFSFFLKSGERKRKIAGSVQGASQTAFFIMGELESERVHDIKSCYR